MASDDPEVRKTNRKTKGGKVVKLSEIKTNADRRWRRQVKAELNEIANAAVDELKVKAYTVVLWDEQGHPTAYWNTEKLGPDGILGPLRGELTKKELDRAQAVRDAEQMIDETYEFQ